MAGHEWEDWFEREEFIGQISDIRVQNLQVERELVQKRTFTRWMNLHLEKCDPPVEVQDLFRDIQDGHVLMALLEELSGCKLLHGFKKSSHRIFRLNNIAKVLSFLEERNVKLVSIDAADVADGNSSIILGLIWNIILFFQIKELTGNIRSQFPSSSSLSSIPTSSDSSYAASHEGPAASSAVREHGKAIKKLLQWVQKRTRKFGVAVKDFGKSWTSGLAFLAVIKSIDSSLVDMRKAMLRSTKDNLEDAFRIAHYSLGIPRLLEPEDVTINAPDEQSIMTYVSQFLEHFPGMEEPEETSQLIARSVSMSRLNFRDTESNRTRTSRVKEASSMFQRGSARPPPKILISSVSEDRSVMSASFRPPAARSWSSEDFLADHPHMDVVDVEESSSEVLTDSPSHSPQPSHSPTALESVNTESVVGDSAISSPDSEFGGMPEKFSESRSDSSLCDSGMSWDVYRATPVEVTSCDEGWSVTESYMDEGIYSLSSLDSNQERLQGQSDKNFVDVEKDVIFDNNQDAAFMQLPDHSNREMNKEVGSQAVDTSQSREQEPGLRDTEELIKSSVGTHPETEKSDEPQLKHTNEEERTSTEQERLSNIDAQDQEGQLNGGTESERNDCDSVITESPKDSLEFGVLQEWSDGAGHTQDDAIEGVVRNTKESFSSETSANTHPSSQDGSSETTLVQESAVPLISVSSEGQDAAGNDEPEGTDAGVISLKTELNSNDSVEVPSCLVPDHTSMENKEICGRDASHNVEISESRQECELLDAEKDLMFQIPPTDTESHSMNTDQERVSAGRLLGHQNKLGDEVASARENILDPVSLNVNGRTDVWSYQPQSVSRDVSNADIDPPKEDGAGVEPMDLFYPDKEESVCPEPLDTEMQSWPSVLSVSALQPAPTSETPAVLSVSALQPAPTSETPADEHDFRDGLESTLGNKKEDDEVSAAHEHGLFLQEDDEHGLFLQEDDEHGLVLGEKTGAVWSGDALEDGSENAESMSKQHEDQTAPVLRHRKGLHFTVGSTFHFSLC